MRDVCVKPFYHSMFETISLLLNTVCNSKSNTAI